MHGNEGDESAQGAAEIPACEVALAEVSLSEVPLSEILGEVELPPRALVRWFDHLDAFFARHGGPRRYRALAALVAEARAAQALMPPPAGGAEPG